MKGIKEFKPLLKLVKEEKAKLIIASIIIFASGLCEIFTGYLNGAAVEAITKLDIRTSLMYLFIYFVLEVTMDGGILFYGNMLLLKVESSLTRKLGFLTYKKVLNLPSVAFEKTSSGEIINRITSDADTLSFTFKKLLTLISSLVASLIIIISIFLYVCKRIDSRHFDKYFSTLYTGINILTLYMNGLLECHNTISLR